MKQSPPFGGVLRLSVGGLARYELTVGGFGKAEDREGFGGSVAKELYLICSRV